MSAGKGSSPRPYAVDLKTFDANWNRIFPGAAMRTPTKEGYYWARIQGNPWEVVYLWNVEDEPTVDLVGDSFNWSPEDVDEWGAYLPSPNEEGA